MADCLLTWFTVIKKSKIDPSNEYANILCGSVTALSQIIEARRSKTEEEHQ